MLIGTQPQLLATKILRPRPAAGLIERPRLFDLVSQVQAKQLTIIKAGAGFGKTSLAVHWAERLQQSGNVVAWLALDAEDNEPARFLFYLSRSLQRASNGLGEEVVDLVREGSLALPRTIVSALINDLTNIGDEIFLFLDDYHWLTHSEIQNAISFLLRRAPSNLHLVLITRSEPHFSLTRLRAQNQLLEVDVEVLRFSLDETRQFFEQEGIGKLESSDVRTVHAKTEGWPAILRIIASTYSRSAAEFGQFASRLSGAARPIGAYFDEMLDGLSAVMVKFMLRTAILDRFSASLCQAVTGEEASDDMLESIERRQLLLTPLDQERQWYRYHPLLAGYLQERLEREFADEIPELRRLAARWFAAREIWTEAIQYAIWAGDTEQAVGWIENCAMALVKRGDMLTLLGWQRILPADLMRKQIKVRLAIAWGLALGMRSEEALQLVTEIEQDISSEEGAVLDALTCECLAIRSIAVAVADDSSKALGIAESCLNRHPTDPWTANATANVALFCYWKAGDLKKFHATPWVPFSLEESKWNVFASIYRLCLQGLVEVEQLRVDRADRFYEQAMQLAEQHVGSGSVAAALPASLISVRRYDQGRLEEAENLVIDRLPIINAAGMLECVACAYVSLMKIAICRKNTRHALTMLEQAESLSQTRRWGRLIAMTQFWRLQFCLAENRISEAGACLERLKKLEVEYPAPSRCAWSIIPIITARGRASLAEAENRLKDSARILRALHGEANLAQYHYVALMAAVQLSTILLKLGETDTASNVFCDSLRIAASADMYQVILDGGPQVGKLLLIFQEDARRTGQSRELLPFVDRLITGWRERYEPKLTPDANTSIAELLSARERNIIELIARGQSNKEVARDLGISPETVKSHVKHIFVKLDVDKRTQAVVRAQSLGLVSTQ